MTKARCLDNIVRKYAFQWWGGFNLSPLILYPPRAIITVSEDDTCEFDKNRCMRKQTFRPFFSFSFFLNTDFYDRQKYCGGDRQPCRPYSDAHAILRRFLKSVM